MDQDEAESVLPRLQIGTVQTRFGVGLSFRLAV
jgi:hypothetical protein